jgi:hypothetical protein
MNLFQRSILAIFLLMLAAMAAIPPWAFEMPEVRLGEITYPSRYRFAGYAPIYNPPEIEDWARDPAAQPKSDETQPVPPPHLLDYSQSFQDQENRWKAFIARHERDNIRTAQIDLIRLSVQMIGVMAFGAALFLLGSARRANVETLTKPNGRRTSNDMAG